MRTDFLIQSVLDSVSFEEASRFYGVHYNSHGFARCPFHAEKTASFDVHNNRGHCFGCGWSGNIINFVRTMYGLNTTDAIEKLNTDFHLCLPIRRKASLSEMYKASKRHREVLAEQERAEQERVASEEAYWFAWDGWITSDKALYDFFPLCMEDITEEQAKALRLKDYYADCINSL